MNIGHEIGEVTETVQLERDAKLIGCEELWLPKNFAESMAEVAAATIAALGLSLAAAEKEQI